MVRIVRFVVESQAAIVQFLYRRSRLQAIYIPLMVMMVLLGGCTVQDYGIPTAGGKPRVSSNTYLEDIAEGNVSGHAPWYMIGVNPHLPAGTSEELWTLSTTYVFPTAPIRMEVVSDQLADAAAGAGAQTVTIWYLDGTYAERSETVTMNGNIAVGTESTTIYRVNHFAVSRSGGNGVAAGNITLRAFGGGTAYNYIGAGLTRARTAVYTVPLGKTLYVTSITYSTAEATKGVRCTLRATYDPYTQAVLTAGVFFMPYTEVYLYNNAIYIPLVMPLRFPTGVDLKVSGLSSNADAIAEVQADGWIEVED